MGRSNSVRRESTREEKKGLESYADDKNARHEQGTNKARTVAGRGKKSLLCDPGSELRLGGRE